VCPNNHESLPKRRKKKGAEEEEVATGPKCTYQKKVAGPAAKSAEQADAVVESVA
jgi:DNA topoisomerase-1